MDEQTRELKERISRLSNEELLRMIQVEFADYRTEALDFARTELTSRGIKFKDPSRPREIVFQEPVQHESTVARVVTCPRCGGKARPGVLLGEKEITIMFSDEDEQRFVEAYACVKCGHVQFIVDLETDVAEDQSSGLA
jgi:ribosomal protein S27AE